MGGAMTMMTMMKGSICMMTRCQKGMDYVLVHLSPMMNITLCAGRCGGGSRRGASRFGS
jgi:hypothetical protein